MPAPPPGFCNTLAWADAFAIDFVVNQALSRPSGSSILFHRGRIVLEQGKHMCFLENLVEYRHMR